MRLAQPDGRTREARLLRSMRRALIDQLGGEIKLTPQQRTLIERAAMLQLRVASLDQRIFAGTLTGYDHKSYIAFCNALRLTMVALGLEASAPPSPKLADYLVSKTTAYVPSPKLEPPEPPSLVDYIAQKGTAA
jgi:hypothetical protein